MIAAPFLHHLTIIISSALYVEHQKVIESFDNWKSPPLLLNSHDTINSNGEPLLFNFIRLVRFHYRTLAGIFHPSFQWRIHPVGRSDDIMLIRRKRVQNEKFWETRCIYYFWICCNDESVSYRLCTFLCDRGNPGSWNHLSKWHIQLYLHCLT